MEYSDMLDSMSFNGSPLQGTAGDFIDPEITNIDRTTIRNLISQVKGLAECLRNTQEELQITRKKMDKMNEDVASLQKEKDFAADEQLGRNKRPRSVKQQSSEYTGVPDLALKVSDTYIACISILEKKKKTANVHYN